MRWLMQQQLQPEDYVIATGERYSVGELVEAAVGEVGIELRWKGFGVDEKGYDPSGRYKLAVDLRYSAYDYHE
ncbi:MAG: GDP-mannose 4,6-dehydratase [Betaproteobacteria bacterium]|nr:GDP-mannose 4,6-dehydratase [Betaproteobacteria bacterium]